MVQDTIGAGLSAHKYGPSDPFFIRCPQIVIMERHIDGGNVPFYFGPSILKLKLKSNSKLTKFDNSIRSYFYCNECYSWFRIALHSFAVMFSGSGYPTNLDVFNDGTSPGWPGLDQPDASPLRAYPMDHHLIGLPSSILSTSTGLSSMPPGSIFVPPSLLVRPLPSAPGRFEKVFCGGLGYWWIDEFVKACKKQRAITKIISAIMEIPGVMSNVRSYWFTLWWKKMASDATNITFLYAGANRVHRSEGGGRRWETSSKFRLHPTQYWHEAGAALSEKDRRRAATGVSRAIQWCLFGNELDVNRAGLSSSRARLWWGDLLQIQGVGQAAQDSKG